MVAMKTSDALHDRAVDLVEAARAFHAAAQQPTSHEEAPESLASLEEALQALSAAWYQLAASAPQVEGFSREQEVRLRGTLHDVAAAFARCARACREGRSTIMPITARRMATGRADHPRRGNGLSWFGSHERPTERVP
jgi:hypothetical protein